MGPKFLKHSLTYSKTVIICITNISQRLVYLASSLWHYSEKSLEVRPQKLGCWDVPVRECWIFSESLFFLPPLPPPLPFPLLPWLSRGKQPSSLPHSSAPWQTRAAIKPWNCDPKRTFPTPGCLSGVLSHWKKCSGDIIPQLGQSVNQGGDEGYCRCLF